MTALCPQCRRSLPDDFGLVFDALRTSVSRDGRTAELTPSQFKVLYLIAQHSCGIPTEGILRRTYKRYSADQRTRNLLSTHITDVNKRIALLGVRVKTRNRQRYIAPLAKD